MTAPDGIGMGTVLVVAKAPIAGLVKTRIAATVGTRVAADLAAAALLDTLSVASSACAPGRRVLAVAGDLRDAERAADLASACVGWTVVEQVGGNFGRRLAAAHRAAADVGGAPVTQIGMDTPQLTRRHLTDLRRLVTSPDDASVGPAADGGWWGVTLGSPRFAERLSNVRMSTARTGACTMAAFQLAGARVRRTTTLTDADTWMDAILIAAAFPDTRFAAAVRHHQAGAAAAEAFQQQREVS